MTLGPAQATMQVFERWRSVFSLTFVALLGVVTGGVTVLLGEVTSSFLEVLIGTTVTVYGFLIVGMIFVFEQQRRAWPIMRRLRDPDSVALRAGVVLGTITGAGGLIFGGLLIGIDTGGVTPLWFALGLDATMADRTISLLQASAWIVAPLAVTSIVVFLHVVHRLLQLLSPRSISDRVNQAARRAARVGKNDEAMEWVDTLKRLTIEHLISRNSEEYSEHVHSLGRLAVPGQGLSYGRGDGFIAWLAIDRLISISDRASTERDLRVDALECAVAAVNQPRVRGSIPREQRTALAERVAPMLNEALSAARPSAQVSALLLRLGLLLYPSEEERAALLADTLASAVLVAHPSDVWKAVSGVLTAEVSSTDAAVSSLEVAAAVDALSHRLVDANAPTRQRRGYSNHQSHAKRVCDLLDALGIGPNSSDTTVHLTKLPTLLSSYAWVLAEASGHEHLDPTTRRRLARRFARLWRAHKLDLRSEQDVPKSLQSIFARLSPADQLYVRFVVGIEAGLEDEDAKVPKWNFITGTTPSREDVQAAIQMVLATYRDPVTASIAIKRLRSIMAREGLLGMTALPTFMHIGNSVSAMLRDIGTDNDLSAFTISANYIDIDERATGPRFFDRGLAECTDLCYSEIHLALKALAEHLPSKIQEPAQSERLSAAEGLLKALGLATFALAVAIDHADGLSLVGRFAENVPWFARPDQSWTRHELLRLAHDALWLTNIVMDLPLRIAPKKAGLRNENPLEDGNQGTTLGQINVRLPDGTQALRMREAWRLAAVRSILNDVNALVGARAQSDRHLHALAIELGDAVALGKMQSGDDTADDSTIAPDRIEQILAEAIVSVRRYHHWHWMRAVEKVDWNRIGPTVWASAVERLANDTSESLEPTGIIGLLQIITKLDEKRMPNEARLFLASLLQQDLPHLGETDDSTFSPGRVGSIVAKALILVVNAQVYDTDVHDRATQACIEWANRSGQQVFVREIVKHLAKFSEHNPLLRAIVRSIEVSPHLSLWGWRDWKKLKTVDPRRNSERAKATLALERLGIGTRRQVVIESVAETFAKVRIEGVTTILPVSEAGWTDIPDLRLVLNAGDRIDVEVVQARSRQDAASADDPELVLSRKPLVANPRRNVRAAIGSRSRQDARFLGRHRGNGPMLVQLTALDGWVIARLVDTGSGSMPDIGSNMRVVLTDIDNWGRISART